ncbi:hypothetical protein PM082_023011 [Marasmius tenuissimus]|nr:hypothetical protein PM082_023011 [Marasmius tenuissimus]
MPDTEEDITAVIEQLPPGVLEEFCHQTFQTIPGYVERHPELLENYDWVDLDRLLEFLDEDNDMEGISAEPGTRLDDHAVRIKEECDGPDLASLGEHPETSTRTHLIHENGHDVTVILDSDDEEGDGFEDFDVGGDLVLDISSSQDGEFDWDNGFGPDQDCDEVDISDTARSSPTAVGSEAGQLPMDEIPHLDALGYTGMDREDDIQSVDGEYLHGDDDGSETGSIFSVDGEGAEVEQQWVRSDRVWLDDGIFSEVLTPPRHVQLTKRKTRVEVVERVRGGFPSYIPIPRVSTAFLVDLTDTKLADLEGEMDNLIRDHEQETWHGQNGKSDSKPMLSIFTGSPVPTRRRREKCAGVTACECVDASFLPTKRYELDPDAFSNLVEAQINARMEAASTVERKTLIFYHVVNTGGCPAKDSNGNPCLGVPVLRAWKDGQKRGGYSKFVACSGWKPSWEHDHRSFTIPNGVDEAVFTQLFESKPIQGATLMSTCSRIVPSRVGLKASGKCKYPHNSDGTFSKMVKHQCKAHRTIYVPLDTSIRMACIVYKVNQPHTHPTLPLSKPSKVAMALYTKCVRAAGTVGATVQSVENAASTKLVLGGKSLPEVHPALMNRRVQQRVIDKEKKKMFPYGRGFQGAVGLYDDDQQLPKSDRYVQEIQMDAHRKFIFTFNAVLLGIIHDAVEVGGDGTFKRVDGEFDEYELTAWATAIDSAVTIGRIYVNSKDRRTYKLIYDGIQRHVEALTDRPLRFYALQKGGNVRAIGTDMELAELQGIGDSLAPLNEPEYSGIPSPASAETVMPVVSRICVTHYKRGVLDLRSRLTDQEYNKLMNLPYAESETDIAEVTALVAAKKDTKLTNWWADKQKPFILSGLVKCRTKMSEESWNLTSPTTNINEGMHSFTNRHTGIKKSLVEAILAARELDNNIAKRLLQARLTGIIKNPNNSAFDRMVRNANRHSSAARKKSEVTRLTNDLDTVKKNLAAVRKRKPGRKSAPAESSSSGRVASSSTSKTARQSVDPYPRPSPTWSSGETDAFNFPANSMSLPVPTMGSWDVSGTPPFACTSNNLTRTNAEGGYGFFSPNLDTSGGMDPTYGMFNNFPSQWASSRSSSFDTAFYNNTYNTGNPFQ